MTESKFAVQRISSFLSHLRILTISPTPPNITVQSRIRNPNFIPLDPSQIPSLQSTMQTIGRSKMEEMTLPALFEQARKIHQSAFDSAIDQDEIRKGCEVLERCEEMIGKLGLFSSNETKQDISAANLKYLLVPYYLGELLEKISGQDRTQTLKASQAKLKEFSSFCEAMELIPQEELESTGQSGSNSGADRRARKPFSMQLSQADAQSLCLFHLDCSIQEPKNSGVLAAGNQGARERRGRSTRAATSSTPLRRVKRMSMMKMEKKRERLGLQPSLWHCALDLLEMLKLEEDMLSAMREKQLQNGTKEFSQDVLDERAKRAEAWHRTAAARARFTKPADPLTCATFAQDVLEGRAKVSQLVSSEETSPLRGNGWQHRLPTMSIEEAGLKEMEMMNKWQERNKKFMEEANSSWYNDNWKLGSPGEDGDEDAYDDVAVEKARAWDDWKDDNPRGAGYTKLTPCGCLRFMYVMLMLLS
ncbi:PP2A regulatory subunit TAP46-like protein [Drosera capensis]